MTQVKPKIGPKVELIELYSKNSRQFIFPNVSVMAQNHEKYNPNGADCVSNGQHIDEQVQAKASSKISKKIARRLLIRASGHLPGTLPLL